MKEQNYEQLTLFPEDFLASLSLLPGGEEARKMTVISGQRWLGLSKNYGPLGLLEKMLLESSIWNSKQCFLIWKPRGMPQGHFLFQLAASVPRTGDTGPQLWPTPKASDAGGTGKKGSKSAECDRKKGNLRGVVMYATPQARDYRTGQAGRWEDKKNRSRNLNDQIAMYPTPTGARLCGGSHAAQTLNRIQENGHITEQEKRSMKSGNGGQLNPEWVEWLMGFPIGWTDLNAWEMQ